MANQTDPHYQLAELFKQEKCYTINQLSGRLNYSLISIRRFLKVIGYYTSFTHNSKWYTLRSIPSFNKNGIWFYQDAYSDQIVHPFRTIPSTGSEGNHPVIPKLTVQFFGA